MSEFRARPNHFGVRAANEYLVTERAPSFYMLVPGPWHDVNEVVEALEEQGISAVESGDCPIASRETGVRLVKDGYLADGFRLGARGGRLAASVLDQIASCRCAALIERGLCLSDTPSETAEIGRALRNAGGVAVRMEASGAASEWKEWMEDLESDSLARLYTRCVLLVRDEDDALYTCGMHQFDLPDAQLGPLRPADDAAMWLDEFSLYQIRELPSMVSGHTFRPHVGVSRRVVERWPDHRHIQTDGRHNPFGLWHLVAPDAARVTASDPVVTITPPLVAQLLAAEKASKCPLNRSEVDAVVNQSHAVALTPDAFRSLESARGYADLEPQLAWEQWQIVRQVLLHAMKQDDHGSRMKP